MTREEVAGLKPGTEVLVRATLTETAMRGEAWRFSVPDYGFWVTPENVHSIAPPKPLQVGDRATNGRHEFIVRAIHGHEAWCQYGAHGCSTQPLSSLRRAE